jgi:hypothetical protein
MITQLQKPFHQIGVTWGWFRPLSFGNGMLVGVGWRAILKRYLGLMQAQLWFAFGKGGSNN